LLPREPAISPAAGETFVRPPPKVRARGKPAREKRKVGMLAEAELPMWQGGAAAPPTAGGASHGGVQNWSLEERRRGGGRRRVQSEKQGGS